MKFVIPLIAICLFAGCHRNTRKANDGESAPASVTDTTKSFQSAPAQMPFVNVYIENSGSMDGYVNGATEFKGAIRDLLVLLRFYYGDEKINVYFINNAIHQVAASVDWASFAQNINSYWRVGNRSNSELNSLFRMVLEKTDQQSISILLSDYIYSIPAKGSADGLLNDAKSLTKDAFLTKWKNDNLPLATTIIKLNSKFNGRYFPYTGDAKWFQIDMERPYYMCVIGSNDLMIDFNARIPLERGKVEGFDNKYIISTGLADKIYYSVLLSTANVGRFKASRRESAKDYVRGIEDVNMRARGRNGNGGNQFTFAVAVDLKNVAAEEEYFTNPENYLLGDNNFRIKEIMPVDKNKINASDWLRISGANPTHLIVLEATGTAVSNVKLALKKQIPQWVYDSNTIDDTSREKLAGKTFGLKYWVEGIAEAYQIIYPDDKYFFEFEIKINK